MGLFFYFLACFSAVFSLLSSHCSDGADIFGQSCGPFFGFLACVFIPSRDLFCFHTALILQIFIGKTEVKLVHVRLVSTTSLFLEVYQIVMQRQSTITLNVKTTV